MAFAQALIKVWRLSPRTVFDSVMPYPNFVNSTGVLERRVERLLNDKDLKMGGRFNGPAAFLAIIIITTAALYLVC